MDDEHSAKHRAHEISRWGLLAVLCALWLLPTSARAAGASADPQRCRGVKTAAELSRAGIAAREASDLQLARQSLTEAFLCEPAPELLYQLALVAAAEGRELSAYNLMRSFIEDPSSAPDETMRAQSARILEKELPTHGKVKVQGDSGAMLWVDEHLAGALPLRRPLALSVGRHQVRLDYQRKRRQGNIEVLARRVIEIQFEASTDAVVMNIVPAALLIERMTGIAAPEQTALHSALVVVVEDRGLAALSSREALARSPQLAGCIATMACQLKVAEENSADYIVLLEAAAQPASGPRPLSLSIVDATVGDMAGSSRLEYRGGAASAVVAQLRGALETLWGEAQARTRGTLEISSTPPGVELQLDGRVVGKTPYQHAAFSGQRELTLIQPGYKTERRTIAIEKDAKLAVDVSLQPESVVVEQKVEVPRRKRPIWRLAAGSAAITLGVLMAGFGAGALVEDTQCIGAPDPMASVCRKIYDTRTLGAGLVGAGVPIFAAGVLLIAWPAR